VVGHTSGVDSKFEEEFVATLGILEPKDLKKNCAIIIVQTTTFNLGKFRKEYSLRAHFFMCKPS
jgi:hypothetical protein